LKSTAINGVTKKTVFFVTPEKTYATNTDGGVSLLQTFDSDTIFTDITSSFCFCFYDINETVKKFNGLHGHDLNIDFEYADDDFEGFRVAREITFSCSSPRLRFTLYHPTPEYNLEGDDANPYDKIFDIDGGVVIPVLDGKVFMESVSRTDGFDAQGNPLHIKFYNESGFPSVMCSCTNDFFECGIAKINKPFKVYKKDLESIKKTSFNIHTGSDSIVIEQGNSKFYIATTPMEGDIVESQDKELSSFLDLTRFTHDE